MKITKRQLVKIIKENRSQEIVKLVTDRIKDVGFGDEDEEDFESVKIELEEDGLASQDELDQLTFERWKDLKESKTMKITKRQLRRIIKEEIAKKMQEQGAEGGLNVEAKARQKVRQLLLSEFFGFGKKKATTPKFPEVDLQRLGEIIEEHAFEEDVPANSPRRDLSIDKNLEWLATSDEEIKRLGKAYRRSPEEVQAFLDLDLEQRKKMIRGR